MRSISFTAEDLFLDGTAKFAGPDDLNFNILSRSRQTPENMYKRGIYCLHGYGVPADKEEALFCFSNASSRGSGSASYSLYVLKGEQRYLLDAASQGHLFSQSLLMQNYAEELFTKAMKDLGGAMHLRDFHKAFYILEALGKSGHAEAYYQLAVYTERVLQDEANLKHSFNWALQAAQLGHVEAQFHVAQMFLQGRGTLQDQSQATEWHEIAMENSHKERQCYLS